MLRTLKRSIIRGNHSGKYLRTVWHHMVIKRLVKALRTMKNEPSKVRMAIRVKLIKMTLAA
jgi:hypothetical protein